MVNTTPHITPKTSYETIAAYLIDMTTAWTEFLTELKKGSTFLQKSFHYDNKSNVGEGSSLFGYLSFNIDLDQSGDYSLDGLDLSKDYPFINYIYDKDVNFWNESVEKTVTDFLDHDWATHGTDAEKYTWGQDTVTVTGYIPLDSTHTMRIQDIREANAGRAFLKSPSSHSTSWVIPWYNIDWETYQKVRRTSGGNDGVLSVLASERNLQFTRSQDSLDYWLRLIMPKYTRRVEIEDLNRDFWVISSTLGGISAWLFDKNSPLVLTLKRIIDELMQIWNNLLFLWIQTALEARKQLPETHVEIVPLNITKEQTYRKFDYFDSTTIQTQLKDRLDYLLQKYSKSNLVVLPQIRLQNYTNNYYKEELYPMILWCNRLRGDTEFKSKTFSGTLPDFDIEKSGKPFSFSMSSNAYSFCNQGGGLYSFKAPFKDVEKIRTKNKSQVYYAAARIIPSISVNFTDKASKLTGLTFSAYEAVKSLKNNDSHILLGKVVLDNENELTSSTNITFSIKKLSAPSGTVQISESVLDYKNQIYLGEVISTAKKTTAYIDVNIHKLESAKNTYLSGVSLTLTAKDGGTIRNPGGTSDLGSTVTWTTDNSMKTFELTGGHYTVKENSVPNSNLYDRITDEIDFYVEHGKIEKVTGGDNEKGKWVIQSSSIYNSAIITNIKKPPTITVNKKDENSNDAYATFKLKGPDKYNGDTGEKTSTSTKSWNAGQGYDGSYTLTETAVGDDELKKFNNNVKFTISDGQSTGSGTDSSGGSYSISSDTTNNKITITIKNAIKKMNLTITKKDIDTDTTITNTSGLDIKLKKGSTEITPSSALKYQDLLKGDYTLEEVSAPTNYQKTTDKFNFSISKGAAAATSTSNYWSLSSSGNSISIILKNKKKPNIKYTFTYHDVNAEGTIVKIGNYIPKLVFADNKVAGYNAWAHIALNSKGNMYAVYGNWVPWTNEVSSDTFFWDGTTYNFYWNKINTNPDNINTTYTLTEAYSRLHNGDNGISGQELSNGSIVTANQLKQHFLEYTLPNLIDEDNDNIQYYITEYGAQPPWFNYQGRMYWSTAFFAHLFRYFPGAIPPSTKAEPIKKNGSIIGYVDLIVPLGYEDSAGVGGNYSDPNDSNHTWRLPYFKYIGETGDYWSYTRTEGSNKTKGYISHSDLVNIFSEASSKTSFTKTEVNTDIDENIQDDSQTYKRIITNLDNFKGSIELKNGYTYVTQKYTTINKNGDFEGSWRKLPDSEIGHYNYS